MAGTSAAGRSGPGAGRRRGPGARPLAGADGGDDVGRVEHDHVVTVDSGDGLDATVGDPGDRNRSSVAPDGATHEDRRHHRPGVATRRRSSRRSCAAGVDVCRIGLAHGELDVHLERIARIRAAADAVGRPVAVLADLPGPKVRAAAVPRGRRVPDRGRHRRAWPSATRRVDGRPHRGRVRRRCSTTSTPATASPSATA